MPSGYENRRFNRSPVDLVVTLDFGDGRVITGRVINLSLIGLFVDNPAAEVGSECEASLDAEPRDPIALRGCVMHKDDVGIGIEITAIESASLPTLREVIVDHAEDPFSTQTQMIDNMSHIPPLY